MSFAGLQADRFSYIELTYFAHLVAFQKRPSCHVLSEVWRHEFIRLTNILLSPRPELPVMGVEYERAYVLQARIGTAMTIAHGS